MSKVTPLHMAARSRYTDIVALLIDNGADVNLKDEVSYTKEIVELCNALLLKIHL